MRKSVLRERWRVIVLIAATPLFLKFSGCNGVTLNSSGLPNSPSTLSIATNQLVGGGEVTDAVEQASRAFNLTIGSSGGLPNLLAAGFETAADRACPPVGADGLTCLVQPPAGTWFAASGPRPDGTNAITYLNDPAGAHSGSWYAQATLPPSPARQETVGWFFGNIPPSAVSATTIYMEEWLKYPVGWRWRCCGGGNEQKAFILENGNPSGPRPIMSIQADQYGVPGVPPPVCTDANKASTCAQIFVWPDANGHYMGHNQPGQTLGIQADGKWHSIEWGLNTLTCESKVWLDGILYSDWTTTTSQRSALCGPVSWTLFKPGNYFDMDCAGTDCSYYVDDIGLSTTFISRQP